MSDDPRKWHPALASGQALRKEIDAGTVVSSSSVPFDQTPPIMHTGSDAPPEPAPAAPAPEAPPASAAPAPLDGLPPAVYVPEDAAAPQPAPPAYQPPPPAPDHSAELQTMKQQLAEEKAAREALLARLNAAEDASRQAALAQSVVFADDELTSLDANDARVVARKTAEAVAKRSEADRLIMEKQFKAEMERQFQEQQAALSARNAETAEKMRWYNINSAIMASVPDAQALMTTPTYKAYVQQKLEDGSTREDRLKEAYSAGNTDYVTKVLKQVKAALPDASGIVRVMPTTGGTAAPKVEEAPAEDSLSDLSKSLNNVITGSREDREKFRAAWAARHKPAGATAAIS